MEIIKRDGKLLVDSRDVAEVVGKRHDNLVRDINGYIQSFNVLKNEAVEKESNYVKMARVMFDRTHGSVEEAIKDFFVESNYRDSKGELRICYLLTKKGCDMVANKMTGEKGILFTAAYVTKFEEMAESIRLPSTYKEALLQLVSQVEANEQLQTTNLVLEQKVNELQPKASYYDLILQNKSLLTASQIAKDYGIGAPTLNKKLHELGVQYKQGNIWLIYAKHQDKGYTHTATYVLGHTDSKPLTKWTQKGRLFIYDLLKQNGILPMIEREETGVLN